MLKNISNVLIFSISIALFLTANTFSQPLQNYHSISFVNESTAFMVGEDGVIAKSTDAGANWDLESNYVTNVLNSIAGIGKKLIISVGENGLILKSTDGGITWNIQTINTLVNFNNITCLDNSGSIFICADSGKMFVSHDQANTWLIVNTGTESSLKHIDFINNFVGFAVGSNSVILKTVDGGNTWKAFDVSKLSLFTFNSISVIDEEHFTIVGSEGVILNSTDGISLHRPALPPMLPLDFNDIVYISKNEGIIVGEKGVILNTSDNGETWSFANIFNSHSNLDNLYFCSVSFASPKYGIAIGPQGVNYITSDGGKTWSDFPYNRPAKQIANIRDKNLKLDQNFPNPFNPTTVISYDLPFKASVSLKIYDMLGKEVKTLVSRYQAAGSYNFRFDGSNLSSGIYFYVLKANGQNKNLSKTMRMILTE